MVNRVREKRKQKSLSQEKLADLCRCGASTISEIETGTHDPGISLAIRIARALGTTAEYLFGEGVEQFDWGRY